MSRSDAVTSTRPRSNTTAAQKLSRGRASSLATRGSSISSSPATRARDPIRTASTDPVMTGHIQALPTVVVCPPGGIGRRAGFRYQWPRSWGFKSPGGHFRNQLELGLTQLPSCPWLGLVRPSHGVSGSGGIDCGVRCFGFGRSGGPRHSAGSLPPVGPSDQRCARSGALGAGARA